MTILFLLVLLLTLLIVVYVKRDHLGTKATPLMAFLSILSLALVIQQCIPSGNPVAQEFMRESQLIAQGTAAKIAETVGNDPVVIVDPFLGERGPMLPLIQELKKQNVTILGIVPPYEPEDTGLNPDWPPYVASNNMLKQIVAKYPESKAIITPFRLDYEKKQFPELRNRYLILIDQEYLYDTGWIINMIRANLMRLAVVRNVNYQGTSVSMDDPNYFETYFFLMDKNNMWDVARQMGVVE